MEYMKMNIYLNCEHKLQRFLCCSIRCVCFPVVFFWFCFGQKSMDFSIDFWIFIPFTFRSSISSMTRDSFDCDCFFFVIPVISTLMWFHSNLELRSSLWWGLGTDSYVSCNLTLSALIFIDQTTYCLAGICPLVSICPHGEVQMLSILSNLLMWHPLDRTL